MACRRVQLITINKKTSHEDWFFVVELPRFELRITEPKSAVLPLHHSSIVARKRCKDSLFFLISKILATMLLQPRRFVGVTLQYPYYENGDDTLLACTPRPCGKDEIGGEGA